MQCKPLSETEVKKLCDKVGFPIPRHASRGHTTDPSSPNPT
jgi:hypothetical protein